jgi:tetratricopeptide (TPR) repeat protein
MRYAPCLLLFVALACQSNEASEEDRERILEIHVETAGAYLSMGDYLRAADQAQRGLEIDPENFKLRLYLGRSLQKTRLLGDVMRAQRVFREMPRDEDYRVALGLAEVVERLGVEWDNRARDIRAGERFTESPDPELRASELEEEAHRSWNESIDLYQEAYALAPGDPEILNGLVRAHTLLEQYPLALQWGEEVVKYTEIDRKWWNEAIKRPGMSIREEAACRRSLERIDRLEVAVRLNSYTILAAENSSELALLHLDRASELDPKDGTIQSRRAELLIQLERHADALVAINHYLSLTDASFDSEDVQHAFRLKSACEAAISSN